MKYSNRRNQVRIYAGLGPDYASGGHVVRVAGKWLPHVPARSVWLAFRAVAPSLRRGFLACSSCIPVFLARGSVPGIGGWAISSPKLLDFLQLYHRTQRILTYRTPHYSSYFTSFTILHVAVLTQYTVVKLQNASYCTILMFISFYLRTPPAIWKLQHRRFHDYTTTVGLISGVPFRRGFIMS